MKPILGITMGDPSGNGGDFCKSINEARDL